MFMLRWLIPLFILGIPVLAMPSLTLDRSFGVDGRLVHSLGVQASARRTVVQSDGKLVVFGIAHASPSTVRIVRFHPDGLLDTGFGVNGHVQTPVHSDPIEAWHGGILLANGKIIVAGNNGMASTADFALARYNSDGSPDLSFGVQGVATLDFGGSAESINSIAVQTDGRIVAAGKSNINHIEQDFAAARFDSDGSLDRTFANNGKFIFDRNSADIANTVIIQPDGKILIGGRIGPFCGVLRLDDKGNLDPGFGTSGAVIANHTSIGRDLALQPDGKIISVGQGLIRFNSDGTVDGSFGGEGAATFPGTFLSGAQVRPDGMILVAGNSSTFLPSTDENFSTIALDNSGKVVARTDTDFMGHERADAVLLLPDGAVITSGFVFVAGSPPSSFGIAKYRGLTRLTNANADLDGDGRTDISVFRDGIWYVLQSSNGHFKATAFGLPSDALAPADFDGDSKTDITVFRDGIWYQLLSSDLVVRQTFFGLSVDIPLPADHDGDGKDDIAVFRAGTWYMLRSSDGSFSAIDFGIASDVPVRGDFDGDGRSDLAVFRDGIWYQLRSTEGFAAVQFGIAGDRLVPADYDGDGKTDVAVYRDGIWYVLQSSGDVLQVQFGLADDIPVPGDYDGDGRSDIAVYRDGAWYVAQSTSGFYSVQFGLNGDIPVPSR